MNFIGYEKAAEKIEANMGDIATLSVSKRGFKLTWDGGKQWTTYSYGPNPAPLPAHGGK
jgi:hypothetical protein